MRTQEVAIKWLEYNYTNKYNHTCIVVSHGTSLLQQGLHINGTFVPWTTQRFSAADHGILVNFVQWKIQLVNDNNKCYRAKHWIPAFAKRNRWIPASAKETLDANLHKSERSHHGHDASSISFVHSRSKHSNPSW